MAGSSYASFWKSKMLIGFVVAWYLIMYMTYLKVFTASDILCSPKGVEVVHS